VNNTRGD